MKKALIIMALSAAATALAEPTLVYGLDFETHGNADNIAATPGKTAMFRTGYVNYAPNESVSSPVTMNGEGYYHVTNTGTFKIDGGTAGITNASGVALNTQDGFAITLNVLNKSSIGTGWRDVLDFQMTDGETNQTVQVEWNGAYDTTSISLYGMGESMTLNNLFRDTWYNLTISFEGNVCSFTAYNTLGVCVAKTSQTLKNSLTLTLVQGGGGLAGRGDSHILDNFGIYDAGLNDEQLSGIVEYEMLHTTLAQVAPEPATATLSLLALAGLCARRRRH